MDKRLFFIYNSHAGKGRIASKLAQIIEVFTEAGFEVTARPTLRGGEASELIEKLEGPYDLVVASGGDGTLSEAIAGMMKRSERIPMGLIPAGSTNDFASSIGIPKEALQAAKVAVDGERFACDIGSFNGTETIMYVAAFGMFTEVTYETDQSLKNIFGHAAYILEGAKRLGKIKSYPIKVTVDGSEVIEDEFILGMITNSESIGGFSTLGKRGAMAFDDGAFEVALVRKPKHVIDMQGIIDALLRDGHESEYVLEFQASSILLESQEEIAWTIDGESGGSHTSVRITCEPRAIELMVPASE